MSNGNFLSDTYDMFAYVCQKLFQQLAQGASQVPQFTSPP